MEQGDVSSLESSQEQNEGSAPQGGEESSGAGASAASFAHSEKNGVASPVGSGAEVSVATIGRMMGLATASDLKLIDGKIDLLATRVNNLTVRMDKILSAVSNAPTGADLDRIDVTIGALRTMVKEALIKTFGDSSDGKEKGVSGAKIISNKPAEQAENTAEGEDSEG